MHSFPRRCLTELAGSGLEALSVPFITNPTPATQDCSAWVFIVVFIFCDFLTFEALLLLDRLSLPRLANALTPPRACLSRASPSTQGPCPPTTSFMELSQVEPLSCFLNITPGPGTRQWGAIATLWSLSNASKPPIPNLPALPHLFLSTKAATRHFAWCFLTWPCTQQARRGVHPVSRGL